MAVVGGIFHHGQPIGHGQCKHQRLQCNDGAKYRPQLAVAEKLSVESGGVFGIGVNKIPGPSVATTGQRPINESGAGIPQQRGNVGRHHAARQHPLERLINVGF